jgi:hypothetical protein
MPGTIKVLLLMMVQFHLNFKQQTTNQQGKTHGYTIKLGGINYEIQRFV